MEYEINYHPEANTEIENALSWYNEQRKGLAGELSLKIFQAIDIIQQQPFLFNAVYKDFRKINLRIFPYSIIYKVEEDAVIIMSFHHHKRHPKHWKKRK